MDESKWQAFKDDYARKYRQAYVVKFTTADPDTHSIESCWKMPALPLWDELAIKHMQENYDQVIDRIMLIATDGRVIYAFNKKPQEELYVHTIVSLWHHLNGQQWMEHDVFQHQQNLQDEQKRALEKNKST